MTTNKQLTADVNKKQRNWNFLNSSCVTIIFHLWCKILYFRLIFFCTWNKWIKFAATTIIDMSAEYPSHQTAACLFTVPLSWAYANLVWCCIRACAPFWQRIRVKLTQSGSPERYFLFKHCVLALCRCWRRIPAATSRAGRALRTFSAVEGCSHVSRVTCHASRVTPWYMSPAWHSNGPVVLVTAQDK